MRALYGSIALFVGTSLVFVAWPQLDMTLAALFYSPDNGFYATQIPWLQGLRTLGQWSVAAVAVVCVPLLLPKRTRMAALYSLATLAIGTGLLVNALFKENWGRARPIQLAIFGGSKEFTPAWHIADQCVNNCSFISGESAAVFWLLTPALLLCPARYRTLAVISVLIWGVIVAVLRMMFGGHFASDVLLAAQISVMLALAGRVLVNTSSS